MLFSIQLIRQLTTGRTPFQAQLQNFLVAGFVSRVELTTESKLFDKLGVTILVFLLQIVQQLTTLIDQLEKTLTGMMIFFVSCEMLGQLIDTCGKQRNLDLGRTRIVVMQFKALNYSLFAF